MDIEIRPIGPDRVEEAMRMLAASFGEELDKDELEAERSLFAHSRNLAAFDGDVMVGSAAAYPMELTVPGGSVPAGGVTSVGVLPTHRRRGVARSLMRRQLDELHEQGTPAAYLWASESRIYQRFGYGIGSLAAAFDIRRQDTELLYPVEPKGRLRLVDRAEALKLYPTVYDQIRPTRPGMIDRDEAWWNAKTRDSAHDRDGASPYFFVVHETVEGVDGYVFYRVREAWDQRTGPDYALEMEELLAATRDAYVALWRYCFEVDLVRHVKGWKRPLDEPLLYMLAEPRGLGLRIRDGTWLRLVDLGAALEARRYGTEGRMVLEVADGFCGWNQGRWELDGGPEGASCRRTDGRPDLVLDAGTLACAYLGTVPVRTLARAGRVEERTAGSVARADAMFASDPAPWCTYVF